jgi:hypothetical protein
MGTVKELRLRPGSAPAREGGPAHYEVFRNFINI